MRNNKQVKGYLILGLSSLFLLSFALIGSSTYALLFNKETIKENTKIASIEFGGLSKDEALVKLSAAVEEWKMETKLVLQLNKEAILDLSVFTFHLDQTVAQVEENGQGTVAVTIDDQNLAQQLNNQFDQQLVSALDLEGLKAELLTYAVNLSHGIYEVDLTKFIQQNLLKKQLLHETRIPVGDQSVPQIDEGLSLAPGDAFSLQRFVEEKNLENVDDASLSRLATAVYEAFMISPVEIVERHISTGLPEYATLGTEAAFIKGKWDLKALNSSERTVDLSIHVQQGYWIVQALGINTLENYKVVFQNKEEYKPRKIVQYDPALSPSEVKVTQMGENGQAVKVVRQLFQNDQLIDEIILSNDYYPPKYIIEKHGLRSTENISQGDSDQAPLNMTPDHEQPADVNENENGAEQTESEEQPLTDDGLWEIPDKMK